MEGEVGNQSDTSKLAVVELVSISAILILTIVFEVVRDVLPRKVKHEFQPIVESVFGELAVLGFIGIIVFLLQRVGLFRTLSVSIFHDSEVIESLVENIHMVIFAIMCIYAVETCAFLVIGIRQGRKWASLQDMEEERAEKKGKRYALAHRHFHLLREQFVCSHSHTETVFSVEKLPLDFDFALYLTRRGGVVLGEIIEVPTPLWLFFLLFFTPLFFGVLYADEGVQLVLYLVFGYINAAVAALATIKLRRTYLNLIPSVWEEEKVEKARAELHYTFEAGKKSMKRDMSTPLLPTQASASLFPPRLLPAYLLRRIPNRKNGCMARLLFGKDEAVTRHDGLFWFYKRGQTFLLYLIRACLLLNAVYISIFLVTIVGMLRDLSFSTAGVVGITLLAAGPIIVLSACLPSYCHNLTIATSVERYRCKQTVRAVQRHQSLQQALKAFSVFKALHLFEAKRLGRKSGEEGRDTLDDEKRARLTEAFRSFDTDGSGKVSRDEMHAVFTSLGLSMRGTDVQSLLDEYDVDGDGEISLAEFMSMMSVQSQVLNEKPEDTAENIFNFIDDDNSGTITPEELYAAFEKAKVSVSMADVLSIISEFDKDGDGTIGLDEFKAMAKKCASSEGSE